MDDISKDMARWIKDGNTISIKNMIMQPKLTQTQSGIGFGLSYSGIEMDFIHQINGSSYTFITLDVRNSVLKTITFSPCFGKYLLLNNKLEIMCPQIYETLTNYESLNTFLRKYYRESLFSHMVKFFDQYLEELAKFECIKKLFDDFQKDDEIVIEI